MSVYKINDGNINSKLSSLNDMILEINGISNKGLFDLQELDNLYERLILSRKFKRNISVGNSLTDYSNWSHIKAYNGYSIWKYSNLTNYQYNENNELYFDNKLIENKGEALSEVDSFFDIILFYQDGSYTDITTEASSETGTEFDFISAEADYLYCGLSTTFAGFSILLYRYGISYDLKVEYYNGSSWVELDVTDLTENLIKNGRISFDIPDDWAVYNHTYDSVSRYYIRISSTVPTQVSKMYYIAPDNSVENLLILSESQILNEEWGWCTYGTDIYVTIRNAGNINYIGDTYITSTDDYVGSNNKQNFFIYNHQFISNYEDSSYLEDVSSYIKIGDYSDENVNVEFLWEDTSYGFLTIGIPVNSTDSCGLIAILDKTHISETNRVISSLFENPTLRIYSSDLTEVNDFIQFYHNQSNGVIENGKGDLELVTNLSSGETTGSIYLNPSNNIVKVKENDAIYFGEPNIEGTWRQLRDGDNLIYERYESDSWVVKQTISA